MTEKHNYKNRGQRGGEFTRRGDFTPTEAMVAWLHAHLQGDGEGTPLTFAEAARRVGLNPATPTRKWFPRKDFRDWYREQCEHAALAHYPLINYSLVRRCLKGDTKAIQIYFEMFLGKPAQGQAQVNVDQKVMSENVYDAIRQLNPDERPAALIRLSEEFFAGSGPPANSPEGAPGRDDDGDRG